MRWKLKRSPVPTPIDVTNREYAECLGTIIDTMAAYIAQLRRTLDALATPEGGQP
jgi:hypothetical protein